MRTGGMVLTLLLLTACSGGTPSSSSIPHGSVSPTPSAFASPSIAAAPSGMTLMHDGRLHPGTTYATAAFGVRFALTVSSSTPENQWVVTSTGLQRQLQVGDPQQEGQGVQFYLPTGGYDYDGNEIPLPSNFVAWLAENPHLEVLAKLNTKVGGRPAVAVTVRVRQETISNPSPLCQAQQHCVVMASTKPDAAIRPMVILSFEAPTILVVSTNSGPFLILEESGAIQPAVKKLIATLQFLP